MFVSGLSLTIVTSARGLSCMAVLQAVSILKKERFRGSFKSRIQCVCCDGVGGGGEGRER